MIIIRTDASQTTGFGHIKRCAYLASLLKSKSKVLFCITKEKTVVRFLEEKGFAYCTPDRADLLAAPEVRSILFDLRTFSNDDIKMIQQARVQGKKSVQITDLGLSQQDTDYTIDASIEKLFPYEPAKPECDGPDYSMLHHKFRHFNKAPRKYRRNIRNVFICFGGAASYQHLRQATDLLSRRRVNIKIAPGYYLKRSSIKTLRRIYPGTRFVGDTDNLARSFFEADVALISPGTAAYEAAAVGTPALYLHYHKEQQAIAQAFQNKGVGLEIGNIDDLLKDGKEMIGNLDSLTFEKRLEMGVNARQLVDAIGVYRLIRFFEEKEII